MRSTRFLRFAALGLAVSLATAACGNAQKTDTGTGGGGGGATTTAANGTPAGYTIDTSKCDDYQPTVGITDTEIKIGTSSPQSGPYAGYGQIPRGAKAYFDMVNAAGGVKGRKITLISKDDGYEPGRTKTNVDELIDTDKVFAVFNAVGTEHNLATVKSVQDACIPSMFAATGSQLVSQPAKNPWMIGASPPYPTESLLFVDYLKTNKSNAKVGILYQNDDAGLGYSDAFVKAVNGTGITVVDKLTYEPGASDVTSQLTKLKGEGADTLLLATVATTGPSALKAVQGLDWTPTMYLSSTATSRSFMGLATNNSGKGVITGGYLKDPADPRWDGDEDMKKFKDTLRAAGGFDEAKDITNGAIAYGWYSADLLVKALKAAPTLDRKSVMEAAYNMKDVKAELLIPGITDNTNGTTDPYAVEQFEVGTYNGTNFELSNKVVSFEGKTKDYVTAK
jgi:branched-chain amino acid transport system substrate-binding protein